jgi:hypothetical protein
MSWLHGSLGDLVARAAEQQIYISSSSRVRRQLAAPIVSSFRRQFPDAVFVNARSLYGKQGDWHRRWPRECEGYGAAILITYGEDRVAGTDPLDDLDEEHAIGAFAAVEVGYFRRAGRPVAWYAVEFPDTYWIARFVIEPFELMSSARYARLVPEPDADIFCPKGSVFPFADECHNSGAEFGSVSRSRI